MMTMMMMMTTTTMMMNELSTNDMRRWLRYLHFDISLFKELLSLIHQKIVMKKTFSIGWLL